MAGDTNPKTYFEYLQQQSMLGRIYHHWFLYPRLCTALQGKVLDFGCGIGRFLKFRANTIGVDINHNNITYCKSLGLQAELLGENSIIPFERDVFSGVVMDNVIEHIPAREVDAVMDEIVRVLQPCGTVVVGVPGKKGYHSDRDHKVFYTEQDLLSLFNRHGLELKDSYHMPWDWQLLERFLSQYCLYAIFKMRK